LYAVELGDDFKKPCDKKYNPALYNFNENEKIDDDNF